MGVWVLPAGTEELSKGADEDVVLRQDGDCVEVGRHRGGQTEWLGRVPQDSLAVPAVDDATEAPDLEIAAYGVMSALMERGG